MNEQRNFSIKNIAILVALTLFTAFFFLSETAQKDANPSLGIFMGFIAIIISGYYMKEKLGAAIGLIAPSIGFVARYKFYNSLGISEKALVRYLAFSEELSKYVIVIIIMGGILGFLSGYISKKMKIEVKEKSKTFTTNTITKASMFVALGVIITSLRVGGLSFGGFPIIFAGFSLGPVVGFAVGALTDIIAFMIRPSGPFNPMFTLTSALTGLIPVVIVRLLGDKDQNFTFWKVLLGIAIGQIITSVILVPIFLQITIGGTPLIVKITKAAIKQAYSIPLYAYLFVSVHDAVKRQLQLQN